MAYNPQTGLVYIPSLNLCMDMEGAEPNYKRGVMYLAVEFDLGKSGPGGYMGELIAWDPVKKQKVWGNQDPLRGGVLTTAGGLVFRQRRRLVQSAGRQDGETPVAVPHRVGH